MKWLSAIERKMGRHYIPNLMKYLVFAMVGVFVLELLPLRSAWELLMFDREKIFRGEIWRVLTFIILPPDGRITWILVSLYFYYFVASGLESRWGGARFNIYYLIGVIGNIIAGFITGYATNEFLNLTLVLAFGVLYPEVKFMLFFVLPIKARWIAWASGGYFIYRLIVSSWLVRTTLIVSILSFILFFGKDAWLQIRMEYRHIRRWFAMRR